MSKNSQARVQVKADTTANWSTAASKGFTVLSREAIFYTDADASKYPVPFKVNFGSAAASPNSLSFICECATTAEIDTLFD